VGDEEVDGIVPEGGIAADLGEDVVGGWAGGAALGGVELNDGDSGGLGGAGGGWFASGGSEGAVEGCEERERAEEHSSHTCVMAASGSWCRRLRGAVVSAHLGQFHYPAVLGAEELGISDLGARTLDRVAPSGGVVADGFVVLLTKEE